MPVLKPGEPVASSSPLLQVENKLAPGAAVFALSVVDAAGRVSPPAQLRVTVREALRDIGREGDPVPRPILPT